MTGPPAGPDPKRREQLAARLFSLLKKTRQNEKKELGVPGTQKTSACAASRTKKRKWYHRMGFTTTKHIVTPPLMKDHEMTDAMQTPDEILLDLEHCNLGSAPWQGGYDVTPGDMVTEGVTSTDELSDPFEFRFDCHIATRDPLQHMDLDDETEKKNHDNSANKIPTPRRTAKPTATRTAKRAAKRTQKPRIPIVEVPGYDIFHHSSPWNSGSVPKHTPPASAEDDFTFGTPGEQLPIRSLGEGMKTYVFQDQFEEEDSEEEERSEEEQSEPELAFSEEELNFKAGRGGLRGKGNVQAPMGQPLRNKLYPTTTSSPPSLGTEPSPSPSPPYYLSAMLNGPLASLLNTCLEIRDGVKPRGFCPKPDEVPATLIAAKPLPHEEAAEAWALKCASWISKTPQS
ncbi:uncharacterized protein L3040_005028 [Drepanopeziza brunnea f. sp. 'multigermtubi']|uniref:uncharacterized protein n=1 Tax=Drepanopeziza brunnea f. sp. 'multigermtubi' TaxID=698441 RepID=UPI0023A66D4C|nr:hypothetical protein L3040_005028 [Drepanopeziza brunnea f. sp. 'multigermtubi']